MDEKSRIFDCIDYQLNKFPKTDMLAGKEKGEWIAYSTSAIKQTVNKLSAALLHLGISGHDMTVEHQDKIAVISSISHSGRFFDMTAILS